MADLPFKLRGRWQLVSADIVALFAPLVTQINGVLSAANFSRKAGIRAAQRDVQHNTLTTACRVNGLITVPTSGIKMVCPSPKRFKTAYNTDPLANVWVNYALTFMYGGGGPCTGSLGYGGSESAPGTHTQNFTLAAAGTAILNTTGDNGDPATGNVFGLLNITAGAAPGDLVLVAWWRGVHSR